MDYNAYYKKNRERILISAKARRDAKKEGKSITASDQCEHLCVCRYAKADIVGCSLQDTCKYFLSSSPAKRKGQYSTYWERITLKNGAFGLKTG